MHPHPGGLQHQLNLDHTNPTLETGGLRNGDSPDKFEADQAGIAPSARAQRAHNYDVVAELVADRVEKSHGRISAKRLLPIARAAGYEGSAGKFRRLVADSKALTA
ncbi:hypothetical protein MYFR107205_28645 [Mycolicibacterium frederiksbergense]